ncbi:hypothetical protein N7532_009608 [Penicillium argentinense]|uniref:Uncharacterized protein n=1 Tax=Penicillium argentinense TaxID=1131581 RepID=A0A9W9EZU4_9EURO|nr:uncharacterized protein N7532_009608 [Penicillium argentinense]KAJ5090924.1 hypothetical protein N7532_009608 [Penicillium argentinense]
MDSIKTKDVAPEKKDKQPQLSDVEQYQRRWEQLMDDTAKQIQKIRGTIVTSDASHAGITDTFRLKDEEQRKTAQGSR